MNRRPPALPELDQDLAELKQIFDQARSGPDRKVDLSRVKGYGSKAAVRARVIELNDRVEANRKILDAASGDTIHFETGDGSAPFNVNARSSDPHGFIRDRVFDASPADLRASAKDAVAAVRGMSNDGASRLSAVIDRSDENEARLQLAKSDPHYETAFAKTLRSPGLPGVLTADEQRAVHAVHRIQNSLGLETGGGDMLVPSGIDPSWNFTNDGAGPQGIRSIARSETISVTEWKGIQTAGATARMGAELSEAEDNTPTATPVTVPLKRADAYVEWSVEAEGDIPALVRELSRVMNDAGVRLEDEQFAIGTGTGDEVEGFITGLAGTASELAPATAEQFALGDVFDVQAALPTRHAMAPSAGWLLATGTGLTIRELAMAQPSGSTVWADIAAGSPSLLNGAPVAYNDQAANARSIDDSVTAANSAVLTFGDWAQYLIVDHSAGVMAAVNNLVIGANRRPIGARGLYMLWRFGAKVLDANAFRMLSIPTAA